MTTTLSRHGTTMAAFCHKDNRHTIAYRHHRNTFHWTIKPAPGQHLKPVLPYEFSLLETTISIRSHLFRD